MFKFNVTLGDEDILAYTKYRLYKHPAYKKRLMRQLIQMIIPCAFCLLCVFITDRAGLWSSFVVLGIAIIIVLATQRRTTIMKLRKALKKESKTGDLRYAPHLELAFEEDFFKRTTPASETTAKYSVLQGVDISEKAVYVYERVNTVVIIPFAAFADDDEKARFVAFIEGKIAENAAAPHGDTPQS